MPQAIMEPFTLVDAHVHLHKCFPVDRVLTEANKNFSQVAGRLAGGANDFFGCLLLTEMQGESWFIDTRVRLEQSESIRLGSWTLRATEERETLLATHVSGQTLGLFAGRQVVTEERLEVLALLTSETFPDGKPLLETINAIAATGGLPVLPWGVGKWIGQRGTLIDDLLQQESIPILCLGDNSGRPLGWRRPQRFALADQKGLPVLPGTDPLPIPTEVSRPGSFGFSFPGSLDMAHPAASLKSKLKSSPNSIKPFGRLESPWRFVSNQVILRLQKAA